MNSQIMSASSSLGTGFSVFVDTVRRIVPELIENGRFSCAEIRCGRNRSSCYRWMHGADTLWRSARS